jgi:DNA polymerase-2
MQSRGWLFDVYPMRSVMVVWLYRDDGTLLRLEDPWRPQLYARGPQTDLRRLLRALRRAGIRGAWRWTREREFWSGADVEVLAIDIADYGMLPRLLSRLSHFEPRLTFYNCDLRLDHSYLTSRQLFPLGRCEVAHEGATIRRIQMRDSPLARHYVIPSLRTLELTLTLDPLIPLTRGNTLVVGLDGQHVELTTSHAVDLLETLNGFLTRHDPDLLLTDHGDTAILPQLLALARRHGIALALDREPSPVTRPIVTEGRSFMTYGQIRYHPPDYPLFGRWHIDRAHSFVFRETGMVGIVELARLS